jgi:hypothetical protein
MWGIELMRERLLEPYRARTRGRGGPVTVQARLMYMTIRHFASAGGLGDDVRLRVGRLQLGAGTLQRAVLGGEPPRGAWGGAVTALDGDARGYSRKAAWVELRRWAPTGRGLEVETGA